MIKFVEVCKRGRRTKMKKKKWKIALISLFVILLCGVGAAYYFLNIKEYDVADEEVNELTKTEYKVEVPTLEEIESKEKTNGEAGDGSGTSTSGGQSDSSSTEAKVDSDAASQEKTAANSGTASSGSPSSGKASVESIKKRYQYAFTQLEAQATERVDALIGRAYNEYSGKKNNGEEISFSYFYVKYSKAGKNLEAKTDEAFNAVYHQLQNELKANGYSPEHAEEYLKAYKKTKEERRSVIMKKAMAVI